MSKIILAGGFGFIGKNLVEKLGKDHECVIISRSVDSHFAKKNNIKYYRHNIGVDAGLTNIIQRENPDFIFNLISNVNSKRDVDLFDKMWQVNAGVLLHLYKASKNLPQLKLFIQFGSAEEYGLTPAPFNEKIREYPITPYAITKQTTTNIALMLYKNYQFPITILRIGNVFGKYQNDKKIIPLICKKMLKNQLIAMTPGEQKRDFIYVDDLVYVIAQVIKNEYKFVGKIVNISYGKSYSLKKIVKFIKRHTGSSSKLDFGSIPYKKNEIMDLRCDISELRSILDINFRYNFFEALVDYINYLKNTL